MYYEVNQKIAGTGLAIKPHKATAELQQTEKTGGCTD
jgi:hypothetical protein